MHDPCTRVHWLLLHRALQENQRITMQLEEQEQTMWKLKWREAEERQRRVDCEEAAQKLQEASRLCLQRCCQPPHCVCRLRDLSISISKWKLWLHSTKPWAVNSARLRLGDDAFTSSNAAALKFHQASGQQQQKGVAEH